MSLPPAHTMLSPMQSSANASRATPILAAVAMHSAQVQTQPFHRSQLIGSPSFSPIDSCTIKNGGCDANAICSHHPTTNEVVCTCKTGFTNTGNTNVTCTGTAVVITVTNERQTSSLVQMTARSTMVDVTSTPNARTTPQPMLSFAPAKWDTPTLLPKAPRLFAQASRLDLHLQRRDLLPLIHVFADSCLVNNGGCDINAICSHNASNNAAQCTCKTGYTNTGSSSNVICTGK